jgi:ribonuclease VapC
MTNSEFPAKQISSSERQVHWLHSGWASLVVGCWFASLLEAGIVLRARRGAKSLPALYRLVEELGCEIVPFDEPQAKAAIATFGRFGKGMRHRAQLNFGDCAVYALAALRGEPLLATGGDFRLTDLMVVPL